YTLTIKDAAGGLSQRRGYLIVNRVGDGDRVYIATGDKVGLGAGNEASGLTVVGGPDATVGGAELPVRVPQRVTSAERSELPQRTSEATAATKTASNLAAAATANRVPKFDSNGNLIDSTITEA